MSLFTFNKLNKPIGEFRFTIQLAIFATMGSIEKRYVTTISGRLDRRKSSLSTNGKRIRKYCREYCEYTGIHGMRYFGEKRSAFEKICWVAVFVTSLLVCLAVIYQTYRKWQHQPLMVNFSSNERNINEIPFPAVTICQETRVSRSFFNYSRALRNYVFEGKADADDLKKLRYMSLLCAAGKIFKHKIPNVTTIDEDFYKFLADGATQFLESCTWMGEKMSCREIFRPIVTDEGLCYTFNMLENDDIFSNVSFVPNFNHPTASDGLYSNTKLWSVDNGYSDDAPVHTYPRRALLSGYTNALVVNLKINISDIDYACTSFQGYQVVLHQAIRYPIVQIHHFRVPIRKAVIVAISPTQMENSEEVNDYSLDKRDCFLQGEKMLKFFKNYTQNNCELECVANLTLSKCGCVAFYMPRENSTKICGNQRMDCITTVKNKMNTRKLELSLDEDRCNRRRNPHNECNCLPMCAQINYDTEITEIEYDRRKEYESLEMCNSTEQDHHAWSQLVIYFKSSYFIPHVRSELYGHLDFLANVGGLLGLFIGFSLLSLFEIIYFASVRIICNTKMYKKWYGEHNN
ncbi:unnamed protein product [Phyllotreta striolata]|uniref:Uncharacterized protein n=1 Tax=Phyllotreta striolata TaxID=444603 RepID=A0A9N9TU52_PHYSR|nr:unnamed protein product [Phyllotreta striolata]